MSHDILGLHREATRRRGTTMHDNVFDGIDNSDRQGTRSMAYWSPSLGQRRS
jgi:hypothetical protein